MFDLLRQRDFGLLWLAGLISFAGNAALSIALPLHVYRLTDSTLATAAVAAANLLPRVLMGSVAGVFVDRWDRKRTMVVVDLARAGALLLILLAPDRLPVLFAVGAILGTLSQFFIPAEGALLPRLVGQDRLVTANALNALNNNIGMLVGPAMGALLYATIGIGGTVVVDAATFVVSATLISLIASDARPEASDMPSPGRRAWDRMANDWRAGIAVVQENLSLRVLFASSVLSHVADGIFIVLGLSPLVLDVLGGTPAQVGWVASAQAIGGLTVGLVVVRIGHRMTRRWLYGGGAVGTGIADFGCANATLIAPPGTAAVGVAMGWMVLAGGPVTTYLAGQYAIVQSQAVDAYRGRVFGALGSVNGIAIVIGVALGGVLGDRIGIVAVLSAGALLRMLGGIVALILLPRDERDVVAALEADGAPATTA
ncbi:MAG TPA: MFS transporter [Thermomicrobiales bacterium]|nr:MFS transporter [Thermomicrobiales bacterium]